jgi:hypothetical protein
MKKTLIILAALIFSMVFYSCSSTNGTGKKDSEVIKVKNSIVLHQGLAPSTYLVTVFHDLYIELKAEKEMDIVSIDYIIRNPKEETILKETFKPDKPIHLVKGWDYEKVEIETENYGIGKICEQFLAMADDQGNLFPNTVEMTFKTAKGDKYEVKNLILKLQKDGWFIKVWHWIHETGCGGISALIELLKELGII